jgi:D-serine deaminase-like pyridoxal phosphate-dependent protein
MNYRELSTPVLTIDLDILDRNLERMAELCRKDGILLRPHAKTHKTTEVARMQLHRGAIGLTVAKVGEAEVFAAAGFDNILVANSIFGAEKLGRLARLARDRNLLVSLDSNAAAEGLSCSVAAEAARIGVLVEFDSGARRCGLPSGADCVELARRIEKMAALEFRGVLTHFGNIWGTIEERRAETERTATRVAAVLEAFGSARMPVEIVSAGSTPSAPLTGMVTGVTEIRPGTYVYCDLNTYYQGACGLEDCAARIVTTVISTAVPGRAIIDAGSKTFCSDLLSSGSKNGYGYILEAPDVPIVKLNEEHGFLDVTESARRLQVGETLTVIPNHVCACVNMHETVFTLRNGEVVGSWRVAARGKIC